MSTPGSRTVKIFENPCQIYLTLALKWLTILTKIDDFSPFFDQLTTSVPEIFKNLPIFGHSLFVDRGLLPGAWVAELLGVYPEFQDRKNF